MSYYEPSWDEDGNPEVGVWVKEEPDCYACNDGGCVATGWFLRLFRIRSVGCPWCNPGRLTAATNRWRVYLRRLAQPIRRVEYTDEAPF